MKIATESQRARFMEFVQTQPLPLDAECKPWKEPRTSAQNAYLFGVCYPPIAAAMGYDVEDIHEYACGRHFGWIDKPCPKTPRNHEGFESKPFRTTTKDENGKRNVLRKKPFSDFVDTVHRIAAQAGVLILDAWSDPDA